MKVNFQKICAFITAVSLCVIVCAFPVSADDYSSLVNLNQNDIKYIMLTLENALNLVRGDITPREAVQIQTDNTSELISSSVKDLLPFTGLTITETELDGLTNRDLANRMTKSVRDCLSQHGGSVIPTETTENVVDMNGYGAICIAYPNDNYYSKIIYYGDYGIFYNDSYSKLFGNSPVYTSYRLDGSTLALNNPSSSGYFSFTDSSVSYFYYGDWRYEDNTPATDRTIPSQNTIQTNDPSSLTDTQLLDLLQQMINQLKLDMPDLSTIEGLLAAILSQCQSINGKICTSSEIRSMLDDVISQLNNGCGGMSAEDIEKITCAIDNLKYENNNEQFIADLQDFIGMNGEYDGISKLEIVKSHFYEKAGFIVELRNICDTAINAYKNSENSVSFDIKYNGHSFNINFDFWEQYMPMFRFMLAALIYLGFAWRTYRKIPFYISGGGDDN